jgi:superfamily I DNA/RNA helicase
MLVRGCAGSGKTMLAVEIAKRFQRQGREPLFVCFNRALRDHLRQREGKSGVWFHTFHGLCVELASKAGIELSQYGSEAPPAYFREELPAALMEAADKLGPQCDALLVDEAQDLHRDWLDALFALLRDPERDPVWLFMDDNQDVYEVQLEPPEGFMGYDLTVNCRNTQAIAREVHKKYRGTIEPEILGPPGRDPELIQTDDQPAVVAAVLERLCGQEEVPPQDVVVLSSHGIDRSEVVNHGAGRFTFVKEPVALGPYIRFSSIRGFKGLESPVVVLCELEGIPDQTLDSQLYVGISRAKNHCVIVAPDA